MRRIPDVADCWFDSGAMPVAQWHYPFENQDLFEVAGQADFISEAIDQTRGWFYTLLAESTLLFDTSSYRNCVCLGLILDPEGQKMSKSKGNVVEPWDVIAAHGADVAIASRKVDACEVVAALKRRRGGGEELLAYKDGRRWRDVRSEDINDYLKEATGGDFSAKDFRTWHGTAHALALWLEHGAVEGRPRPSVKELLGEVARRLGNTVAVCKKSYVHPRVLEALASEVDDELVAELDQVAARRGNRSAVSSAHAAVVRPR